MQRALHNRQISSRQSHRQQRQRPARKHQSQRDQLIPQVRSIARESPDAIQRNFKRQKNSCRSHQQHGQRKNLRPLMRRHQRIQVSDHEFLPRRNIVAQQVFDHAVHHPRMKDIPDQRHQQQQKWKERQNRIRRDRKSERMHLGPQHIPRRRAQQPFVRCRTKLGRPLLVRNLYGSYRRHCFSNLIKYLRRAAGFASSPLLRMGTPSRCRHEPRSCRHFSLHQPLHQLSSCQLCCSCYYLVLRQPYRVDDSQQKRNSVAVQQDRRFRVSSRLSRLRFRGSSSIPSRVNRSTKCEGSRFRWCGCVCARHCDHILDVALRGCAAAVLCVCVQCRSKQIRRTVQRKHRSAARIILREAKGVSL